MSFRVRLEVGPLAPPAAVRRALTNVDFPNSRAIQVDFLNLTLFTERSPRILDCAMFADYLGGPDGFPQSQQGSLRGTRSFDVSKGFPNVLRDCSPSKSLGARPSPFRTLPSSTDCLRKRVRLPCRLVGGERRPGIA